MYLAKTGSSGLTSSFDVTKINLFSSYSLTHVEGMKFVVSKPESLSILMPRTSCSDRERRRAI